MYCGVDLIDLRMSRYQAEIDPPVLSPSDFEGMPQSNSTVVRHYHPGVPFVLHVANRADLAALDHPVPPVDPYAPRQAFTCNAAHTPPPA